MDPNRARRLGLAGLLAVTALAYAPSMRGGFIWDDEAYIRELLYETHLDDLEQVDRVKSLIPPRYRNRTIYCDPAYPGRIKALKGAGLQAVPGDNDVIPGINYVKSKRLHFEYLATSTLSEIRSYEYMKKGEEVTEHPVDFRYHSMSALRYNLYTRRPAMGNPYDARTLKAALRQDVTPLKFKFMRKG